jgi:hypothetical protein
VLRGRWCWCREQRQALPFAASKEPNSRQPPLGQRSRLTLKGTAPPAIDGSGDTSRNDRHLYLYIDPTSAWTRTTRAAHDGRLLGHQADQLLRNPRPQPDWGKDVEGSIPQDVDAKEQ